MLDLIPPSKQDAVRRALAEGLGRTDVDSVEPLSGGLSGAGVWRLRVGGRSCILRIEGPPNGLNDPHRQYLCMAAAAEAGVAPPVLFADPASGVALIQDVPVQPMPGRAVVLGELSVLLRRLHATPLFPPLVDFPEGVDQLVGQLECLDLVDPAALASFRERWSELRRTCRWGEDGLVSCHNDLNPRNILWDGQRLWLIDWEAAFRNDPYVDLGIAANYFTAGPADQDALIEGYFGAPADDDQRARLFLMQQVCRVYYGAVLMASAAGGWAPSPEARRLEGPSLAEIGGAIAQGRVDLADPAARFDYGAAMLRQMLADRRSA